MASLGTAFVEIRPDTKGFTSALSGQVRGSLTGIGRVGASSFAAIGAAAKGAGLAVGLVGAAAITASIQFESAFAGVAKTVDATDAQLAQLREGILGMSTELPASANEISKVAEAAGQLGIQTDSILGFTRVMVDLGETTNLSSDQAATALARLANITQLPQDQFDRLGATIVDLGNKGASTEAEIVEMGTRIAAAGNQIGLTEPEILAFANALSSVGIEAEAGGTAISRVFIELANAVATGGEELESFADVAGTTAADFQQSFETDAAGATITFIEGLKRIEEEGGNVFAVLDELGLADVRVRNALLSAAGAGDLFRQSLEDGNQAWRENTALTEEAAKRYETTAAQLEITRNKLTAAGIALGDGFLPFIKETNEALDPFLDGLVQLGSKVGRAFDRVAEGSGVLDDLGSSFQEWVGDLRAADIAEMFENIGDAVEDLGPLIKTVGPAFALMSARSLPILGSFVPAINPIGIALGALVLQSEEGREAFAELGQAIAPLAESVATFASSGLSAVADGISVIVPILDGAVGAINLLTGAFGGLETQALITGPAVGAALGFMVGGPWGAAIGGAVGLIGGLGQAFGLFGIEVGGAADEARNAETAIRGLTAAMLEQNSVAQVATIGAITAAFTDLGETGLEAVASLDELGVSLGDVHAAVLSGRPAVDDLSAQVYDLALANGATALEASELSQVVRDVGTSMTDAAEDANTLAASQDNVAFFTGQFNEQAFLLAGELNKLDHSLQGPLNMTPALVLGFQNLRDSAKGAVENTFDLSGSMQAATEAGVPLVQSLVASATQMFGNEQQAMNYTASLFRIPPERFTGVTNTADFARLLVEELLRTYGAIPDSESTTVSAPGAQETAGWLWGVVDAANSIPSERVVNVRYTGDVFPFAAGGHYRANTMALVGEKGPELVSFSRDAEIFPTNETKEMMRGETIPASLRGSLDTFTPGPFHDRVVSAISQLDTSDFDRLVRRFDRNLERVMGAVLAALADFVEDEQTPFASRAA